MSGKIILKRGKEKPLRNHHPWIFSGAIQRVEEVSDGDTADVIAAGGEWLARASYNSRSQIAARVWTFTPDEQIDEVFFERRAVRALELRDRLRIGANEACRLIYAESDGLPGIIVDRYGDYLVVQFLTLGAERHNQEVTSILERMIKPRGIYERSDPDVLQKEGLATFVGVIAGEEPPDRIGIAENGFRFNVDVKEGHKTGFYLDQRTNRQLATQYMRGEVLNAFAYTGAFGVYAARGGARVTNLDASAPSLELARENFALNRVGEDAEFITGDVFEKLREYRAEGRRFDAVILDPPKFVQTRSQMERGLRGYKDINLLAFQLLRPNGFLVTFSCSGLVSADLFQKVVFGAAIDARRDAQIVEKLSQAADHPIALTFPESEYLKGLVVRAV